MTSSTTARSAEAIARATGAVSATYTVERRNEDGSLTETARSTYTAPTAIEQRAEAARRTALHHEALVREALHDARDVLAEFRAASVAARRALRAERRRTTT